MKRLLPVIALLPFSAALAQQSSLPNVVVTGTLDPAEPRYKTDKADLGPLGPQALQDAPQSVTAVTESLMENQQAYTVNDTLRYLPSVEVRDQQGFEVSRPQSRGFQGSIVQNTRLDGLNIIGTTAIAAEDLSGITVMNGLAGALYGPQTAAGVFDYQTKKPTDTPLIRFTESFQSGGIFTEHADVGGRAGDDGQFGYRVNVAHGQGEGTVADSNFDRTLASGTFDWRVDPDTVIELHGSHYETNSTGLPGSIVYDGGATGKTGGSTVLPAAIDPTRLGYGQPEAGADLITDTGMARISHDFGAGWTLQLGGLYQNAQRNLFGITNTLTDNKGDYTVTKNFTAVPHFDIGSNEAYLNGKLDILGLENDVTFGTNGFINGQYSYRTSIATNLGKGSLANPVIFPIQSTIPNTGGEYQSALLTEQSIVTGDTIHFDDQWALQGVLSTSFLHEKSWNAASKLTASDSQDGALSPTVSLIYKPIPALTTYATFAQSIEEGDQAPAGTLNQNQFMAPYRDRSYEIGAKYAVNDHFRVAVDGFRMSRPSAQTLADNVFQVVGTQRNWGSELFVEGDVTSEFSVYGGVTYIDARLEGTGSAATDDKLVVGVPHWKEDVVLDLHPDLTPGFAFTAAVHSESARAATDTNNSSAPGYATVDLGLRYSTAVMSEHHAVFRFQVINATDTRYFSSIADGNIVGSPGANTAYSGAPRTFEASIEADY
ncbi:MAG TPA: TonB-dependent receptor [Magnetospirillaceae bacterium]|nr:TonB-dependent receptor [Magnetospirillaceae bacterium]